MKFLKLCLRCRGKVKPGTGKRVGVWWCPRCEWSFTYEEVEQFVGNKPGGVTTIGPRALKKGRKETIGNPND